MAQGRSLFGEICKNFINSFKPKKYWGELKGRDSKGTEYYESTDIRRGPSRRPSRWFVPLDPQDYHVEKPTEWEIWLRHGRKDPPTEEEIQLNTQRRMATIENAKKLEKPKTQEQDMKTFEKPAFPVYKEYNLGPDDREERKDQQ